jgi:hypothetical protein
VKLENSDKASVVRWSPNLKFSAPPLRSLCLCGELLVARIHRRDAKAAEITQRKTGIGTLLAWRHSVVPLKSRASFACHDQLTPSNSV